MNGKLNDGGFAFPVHPNGTTMQNTGMSLRDYFAAKAMQGIVSTHDSDGEWTGPGDLTSNKLMAETAYAISDAMIKAREEIK